MNKNWFLLLLSLLLLSGCSGDTCIEADDFGHALVTVSARYNKKALSSDQVGDNQIAPWRDSDYRVNGRPLSIAVKGWEYGVDENTSSQLSAWCAWYGQKDNTNTLSKFCERLQDCQFVDDIMCTHTPDARITNAPCLFRKGVGLYALIAEKGSDPNITLASQRDPRGINFHVGAPTSDYKIYEFDKSGNPRESGGRVYFYSSDKEKQQYEDGKLYFKILDKFYDDNNGQYKMQIKSGVSRALEDPISYGTSVVKKFLFGVDNDYGLIRNIYLGVVNNPGYRAAVSAMLSLYIMFTALSYLAGNINLTHTELLTRIVKIAIVSALLSTQYSWSFFNDYLFAYFIGGLEQILRIIMDAGATGPGSPSILGLMLAPQTIAKIMSVLFVDKVGFVYVILFIIALCFIIVVFFQAAAIYLTALIVIGMIITMGPVFICFMLFGITRSLFENWLKQLISYAVQPIILFTGLIFISMILRQEIYGALGFRVCKRPFPKMSTGPQSLFASGASSSRDESLQSSMFYWWFPSPLKGEGFTKVTYPIPVPMDHFISGDSIVGERPETGFCEAYACIENRYIDLPFLDPVKDKRRLNQFWNGKFVQFDGLFLIFVSIYLLHKFNKLAVSTAKFLTGTSGNLTNIGNVGSIASGQAFAAMQTISGRAARVVVGRSNLNKIQAFRDSAIRAVENIKNAPSAMVDNVRTKGIYGIGGLENVALSPRANKAVLAEVTKATGLRQSDINKKSVVDYKNNLAAKLRAIDPSLTKSQSAKLANKMSHKKPFEIANELAKAKFGKNLADLSSAQKKEIESLHDTTLRVQAVDAEKVKQFQRAYVLACQAMSNRGIGIIGNNVSAIRSVEEINARSQEKKALRDKKSQQRGAKIYAKISDLKGGAFGHKSSDITIDPEKEDYNPRKQTYNEILEDKRSVLKREEISRNIEKLSKKYGENVTSPEFLSKFKKSNRPDLKKIKELERADIQATVQERLEHGEKPSLMGRTYMSKYAKDSEMAQMIDRAHEVKQEIFEHDQFISRAEEYTLKQKVATEAINSAYETLKKANHDVDGVSHEQLLEKLQSHYAGALNNAEAKGEIRKVKQAIQELDYTKGVLEQIEQRKSVVESEINTHISEVNKYRTKAGMEEYNPGKGSSAAEVLAAQQSAVQKSPVKTDSRGGIVKHEAKGPDLEDGPSTPGLETEEGPSNQGSDADPSTPGLETEEGPSNQGSDADPSTPGLETEEDPSNQGPDANPSTPGLETEDGPSIPDPDAKDGPSIPDPDAKDGPSIPDPDAKDGSSAKSHGVEKTSSSKNQGVWKKPLERRSGTRKGSRSNLIKHDAKDAKDDKDDKDEE